MTNGDDAAYPISEMQKDFEGDVDPLDDLCLAGGLSKREYFAAMAMQGLMANPERYKYITNQMRATLVPGKVNPISGLSQEAATAKNARKAVYLADALIAALNEKQ